MKDENKTKSQLLTELGAARRRIAVFEAPDNDGKLKVPGETDSEHLFRILVENSLDAMSIVDPDGRLRYLSPPFKHMLGYGPEEQIGANVLEPVHPDDLERASVALAELLQSPGGAFKTEVRVQHKDGSWRTLEVLGNNLIDDPAVGGVVTSFRDVTERKLAEEALKESEAKYSALVEQARDGVAIVQDEGIKFVNMAAGKISGYSSDELLSKRFVELIVPAERSDYDQRYKSRMSGEDIPGIIEGRLQRKDGEVRDTEASGQLIQYQGRPAYMAIVRDVTERKRAEQDLKESEAKYSALIEQARDGVAIFQDGETKFANSAVQEITGYSAAELAGKNFLEMILPAERDEYSQRYEQRMSGEEIPKSVEARIQRKDGTVREIEASGQLIEYEGRPAYMAVARDITERKRMEGELEGHRHHLEELVAERTAEVYTANVRLKQEIARRKKSESALRESEERFRSIVEAIPMPALVSRQSDGTVLYANKHVFPAFGLLSEDITGLRAKDFYHDPADREALLSTLLEQGRLHNYEVCVQKADGTPFWAMASIEPMTFKGEQALFSSFYDVTEHKEANEALRHQEEYFRALIENSLEGITVVKADGTIIYDGPSSGHVLGYKAEELAGNDGFPLIHPEDSGEVAKALNRLLENPEEAVQAELRVRHKDGLWRHIEASAQNLLDNPAVNGIVINFRDITERRQAEDALLQSEGYYRSLIENSLEGVVVVNVDGTVRYESPSVRDLIGFASEERMGESALDLIHPDDMASAAEGLKECMGNPGAIRQEEVRMRHKDGSWRIFGATGQNLFSNPAVEGLVINFRDITERRLAEDALRHQEEYFRSLIENSLEVLMVLNSDGSIRYESPSMKVVTGFTPGQREGGSVFDNIHPDDQAKAAKDFSGLLQNPGSVMHVEVRAQQKDGSRIWIEASGRNLLEDPAVNGIVVNYRDVTERKEAEGKLQELYEQEKDLRQQLEDEISRRIEFARTLTHELKTPLTSVLASTDLLLSHVKDEPLLSVAKNISWGATNLNNRISELLDLARIEVGMLQLTLEPTNLLPLLRESAAGMLAVAEAKGLSLHSELPRSIPKVKADAPRLRQIVLNLLDNAIKFTPRGEKVTLRAIAKGSNLLVSVEDTGRGMTKKEQERVFEPYQRLETGRRAPDGLGLGLALSKTLAELHGGELLISSRRGKGSTFTVSLPILEVEAEAVERTGAGSPWKALLIEDDEAIVESVSLGFQMHWPEVQVLSTRLGEEGIDLVEAESPDIVVLDLGLPDMSGYDVLKEIRLFSSVPIIVLTVRAEEADVTRGLELGADDYVAKPFKPMELLARLKVQLRKQIPPGDEPPIVHGSLRYDPSTSQLRYNGQEISLTTIEGQIVRCLMQSAGRVVTHSRLAESVWGDDYPGAIHSLRVNIQRLRAKVEADPSNPRLVLTRPGIGYYMAKSSYG